MQALQTTVSYSCTGHNDKNTMNYCFHTSTLLLFLCFCSALGVHWSAGRGRLPADMQGPAVVVSAADGRFSLAGCCRDVADVPH